MWYNIHSANQIAAFNVPIRWLWFFSRVELGFQLQVHSIPLVIPRVEMY